MEDAHSCDQRVERVLGLNANMRHTRVFYKERRHRAGCKVCTVALALCFIGLVVAMAHCRSQFDSAPPLRPQDVATVLEFALLADDVCRLVASIATGAPSMIFA